MKYLALFALTLILANTSIAQNCKYDYEKKEEFSGKMTKGNTATIKKTWKLGFNKIGDEFSLGIYVDFYGVREDVIHLNDTLMFAIESANPVILTSMATVKPTSSVVGSQIVTWYQCQYRISKTDILRMSEKNLLAIRVYFGTLYMGLEIPSKNSEKIQKAAACILN